MVCFAASFCSVLLLIHCCCKSVASSSLSQFFDDDYMLKPSERRVEEEQISRQKFFDSKLFGILPQNHPKAQFDFEDESRQNSQTAVFGDASEEAASFFAIPAYAKQSPGRRKHYLNDHSNSEELSSNDRASDNSIEGKSKKIFVVEYDKQTENDKSDEDRFEDNRRSDRKPSRYESSRSPSTTLGPVDDFSADSLGSNNDDRIEHFSFVDDEPVENIHARTNQQRMKATKSPTRENNTVTIRIENTDIGDPVFGAHDDGPNPNPHRTNDSDIDNQQTGRKSSRQFQSTSFVQIIPHDTSTTNVELEQQTLNKTYRPHLNIRQEVLMLVKFADRFDDWNPRSPSSKWQWFGADANNESATTSIADNALFIVHKKENKNLSKRSHENIVARTDKHKIVAESYVDLYSMPFNHFLPSDSPQSALSAFEGFLQSKSSWTVGKNQRLLVRIKFACKVVNAEKHPFPPELVTKSWDDPRLGSCSIMLHDAGNSGLFFSIAVTNKGIWGTYGRRFLMPLSNYTRPQQFSCRRRIGKSPSFDTLIDGGIELDRSRETVNYYLNGYKVWSIRSLGVPTSDEENDGSTSINLGRGETSLLPTVISAVRVGFGTEKGFDVSDPNNVGDKRRLIKTCYNDTSFYKKTDFFWDKKGLKQYSTFGQGAIVKLLKLLVLRAEEFGAVSMTTTPRSFSSRVQKLPAAVPPRWIFATPPPPSPPPPIFPQQSADDESFILPPSSTPLPISQYFSKLMHKIFARP